MQQIQQTEGGWYGCWFFFQHPPLGPFPRKPSDSVVLIFRGAMFRLILRFATKVLDHRSFRLMILEYVPKSVSLSL